MGQEQNKMEEILRKIEQSADEIVVPKELEPEQVKERLLKQKKQKQHFARRHMVEAAAAVALVAVIGGSGVYGFLMKNHGEGEQSRGYAGNATEISEGQETTVNSGKTQTAQEEPEAKKTQVGEFHLAKDYKDVYQAVDYIEDDAIRNGVSGALNGGIIKETAKGDLNYGTMDVMEESKEDIAGNNSSTVSNVDHSETNLQVEGVDESDFIKNDGNYLYLQTDNKVSIVDIRGKKMKDVATIKPEMGADDYIKDMYVDGDQICLILEKRETKLASGTEEESESNGLEEYTDDVMYDDIVYMDTNSYVELQTYDISDRTQGKKTGSVTMDGYYQTSRKNGDYIYLFSQKYIGTISKKDKDILIPEINGEKAEADCIYVQDHASTELIAVSVNVKNPNEIVDRMVLLNANMELYMGTDSMVLYGGNYNYSEYSSHSSTDLTRFTYKDGYMNAVAAASVKGTIQDSFAISEGNGILRVLTTDWSSNSKNQLFLMDENLKLLGSLQDIATGEEIYAARYIGDIAYFITYHNTDPLFAVDISDPENPKMLGQLKVTGYSDYLHPYGENLLLGIGYETDPDTSETLGVKLTMFDISDPKELKVVDTVTVKGDTCPAAEYYKAALVDPQKNLIGFQTVEWEEEDSGKYYVYSWEEDHFTKHFTRKLKANGSYGYAQVRGQYAGDSFYLVIPNNSGYEICSYDMDHDYDKVDVLSVD